MYIMMYVLLNRKNGRMLRTTPINDTRSKTGENLSIYKTFLTKNLPDGHLNSHSFQIFPHLLQTHFEICDKSRFPSESAYVSTI